MDIDVKLERLKMAKSAFLKSHEDLEHKLHYVYPKQIQEAKDVFNNINKDIETIKNNTVIGEDGQKQFSIIFNGKTFTDRKEAINFISDFIKQNSSYSCPLYGLSGEYKGLHISTFFARSYLHEEILLQGNTTSRKNSTSVPADNINRIIEMANGRKKTAEDKQAEIDALYAKIQAGNKELAVPFPQQEEFDKLSLRSAELICLLNEDVDANEREKANMKVEKERRINSILNGEPNSLCEKSFFIFARKQLNNVDDWSETLDKNAISLYNKFRFKGIHNPLMFGYTHV